ncbi:Uncharacterised protein [BD1-7 clade bacterium]|uniref:Nif11 domain-containing protein n=1 Tax=BD1-7 clade bacterium TaxID=2029982 RepID=A0A5S9QXD4_9GAMM|nr:Uncharacterised protein [BD1-7 clade bacterium]
MANAHIKKFLAAIENDAELSTQFQASASGLASIVEFANAHGFVFTLEDAEEFIENQSGLELSDAQLEAIAGGKSTNTSQVNAEITQSVVATGISSGGTNPTAVYT